MNIQLEQMVSRVSGSLVPAVIILAVLTIGRAVGVLVSIHAAEQPPEIEPEPFTAAAEALPETPESSAKSTEPTLPDVIRKVADGLPALVSRDVYCFFTIDDVSEYLRDIRGSELMSVWNSEGVSSSFSGAADEFRKGWSTFTARHAFPLDVLFRGLGDNVGKLEVAVTHIELSGTYSIRLAAVCSIKGDPEQFADEFRKTADGILQVSEFRDVELFTVENEYGTVSVFFKDSSMYLTVGKGVDKYILNRLLGDASENEPLAGYAPFVSALQQFQTGGGSFLYLTPACVLELSEKKINTLTGPVSVYSRVDEGKILETVTAGFPVRHLIEEKKIAQVPADDENCILRISGTLRKQLLEVLATYTLKLTKNNYKLILRKNVNGCFWDYIYMLSDFTDRNMTGCLRWDTGTLLPSWCFYISISEPSRFQQWVQQIQKSAEGRATAVQRSDGKTIQIFPLKRDIGTFGSFCYIYENNVLYCSYSSISLKNLKLGLKPSGKNDSASLEAVLSFSEAAKLLKTFNVTNMIRTPVVDLSSIKDITVPGNILGTAEFSLYPTKSGFRAEAVSATGITGIVPALTLIDQTCGIIKE